jgi:hypothetical protein
VQWGNVAEWATAAVAGIGLLFTGLSVRANTRAKLEEAFRSSYDQANAVTVGITQTQVTRSAVEAILVTVTNGGGRPIHRVRVDLEIAPGAFFDQCEFEFVAPHPAPPAQTYLKFRDDVWDGAGNCGAVPTIEFVDISGNLWTRHGYDGELVLKKGHSVVGGLRPTAEVVQ